MAYLFGLVTKEEAKRLRDSGWDLENPIEVLAEVVDVDGKLYEDQQEGERMDKEMVAVFVDSSLFEVMTGPDWDPVP